MSEKKSGLASYENVADDYLEKRSLKKSAPAQRVTGPAIFSIRALRLVRYRLEFDWF